MFIGDQIMASPSELRPGQVIVLDGELWTVLNKTHTKPGKGPAYYQTKIKQLEKGIWNLKPSLSSMPVLSTTF